MYIDFNLRFPIDQLADFADLYNQKNKYRDQESSIVNELGPKARTNGYLTKKDFLEICCWKSTRPKKWAEQNSEEFIKEISTIALSAHSEKIHIGILTLLQGVLYPTASAILHIVHKKPYPILDFRALWSLGLDKLPYDYTYKFWINYTTTCRELAKFSGLSMRTVDRALWQYSADNQPKK